jgi:hypothetical protein
MSCSIHEAITRIIINIDVECKSTVTISQFLSFLDDLFINVPHAFFFIFFIILVFGPVYMSQLI